MRTAAGERWVDLGLFLGTRYDSPLDMADVLQDVRGRAICNAEGVDADALDPSSRNGSSIRGQRAETTKKPGPSNEEPSSDGHGSEPP